MRSRAVLVILVLVGLFFSEPIIYDQGTNARVNSSLITFGNLTIQFYDEATSGTLLWEQNFTDQIINGSWSVKLNLSTFSSGPYYGETYYKEYQINGVELNYSNGSATTDRLAWVSTVGPVNKTKINAEFPWTNDSEYTRIAPGYPRSLFVEGLLNISGEDMLAIGIGNNSNASGNSSIAIGASARALNYSIAIGAAAQTADYSIVIGSGSQALLGQNIVIGSNSTSYDSCIAFGADINCSGNRAIAIGKESFTSGSRSIAIGERSNSSSSYSVAIGEYAATHGYYSVALGYNSSSNGPSSIALGKNSVATEDFSVAMGELTNASNISAIAIGSNAHTPGYYSTALGPNSKALDRWTIAIGSSAYSTGESAIAIGTEANASGPYYSIAVGPRSKADGASSIALGPFSISCGESSTAVGSGSYAGYSVVDGCIANYSSAIGYGAYAVGNFSLALGGASAPYDYSTAIGYGSTTSKPNETAIRTDNVYIWSLSGNPVNFTIQDLSAASGGEVSLLIDAWGNFKRGVSSTRYKTNVTDLQTDWKNILRLRPVSFNWKSSGKRDVGLIAEEVAEVEPKLVTYDANGTVQGVQYDKLSVYLLQVVQKQQNEIDQLKEIVCLDHPEAEICNS